MLNSIHSVRAELDRAEARLTECLNLLRADRDEAVAERHKVLSELASMNIDLGTARRERDAAREWNAVRASLPPKPPVTREELADALTRRLTTDRHYLDCGCERCHADRALLDRVAAELGTPGG